jgi:membrane protease YdiL (CAAX protease family)
MPEIFLTLMSLAALLGVMLLLSGSVFIWGVVIMRWRRRKPLEFPWFGPLTTRKSPEQQGEVGELPEDSEVGGPTPPDLSPPSLSGLAPAGALALFWLGIALLSQYGPAQAGAAVEGNLDAIRMSLVGTAVESLITIGLLLSLLVMFILSRRDEPIREQLGFSGKRLGEQFLTGGLGFVAALLPVYAAIAASIPLRTVDKMHPFLQIAQDSPQFIELFLVVLTAVLLAPVKEELIFRVVLQPLLEHFLPAKVAIAFVAFLFAAVHHFPDSISILPLGLILGLVFHKTRSSLAVMTLHSTSAICCCSPT